jgi:hypothetical protein
MFPIGSGFDVLHDVKIAKRTNKSYQQNNNNNKTNNSRE